MTRLLVSVRDRDEASIALDAGAHLIDVKEPRRGPLGPADVATIQSVCSLVADRVPVSAALGELLGQPRSEMTARARCVSYAKLGMAACADVADWEQIWAAVLAGFPAATTPVAVIYADWRQAGAPHPSQILGSALKLGCGGVLVDTFDKRAKGLLDHMPRNELASLIDACHARGVFVALAGSLSRLSIPQVLPLAADFLAVRGAACAAGRLSRVDGRRIRDLLCLLNPNRRSSHAGPTMARGATSPADSRDARIA